MRISIATILLGLVLCYIATISSRVIHFYEVRYFSHF
jgi:hypothetical protein